MCNQTDAEKGTAGAAPAAAVDANGPLNALKIAVLGLTVTTIALMASTVALSVENSKDNSHTVTVQAPAASSASSSSSSVETIFASMKGPDGDNTCDGAKVDLPNVDCIAQAVEEPGHGPQAGANVTKVRRCSVSIILFVFLTQVLFFESNCQDSLKQLSSSHYLNRDTKGFSQLTTTLLLLPTTKSACALSMFTGIWVLSIFLLENTTKLVRPNIFLFRSPLYLQFFYYNLTNTHKLSSILLPKSTGTGPSHRRLAGEVRQGFQCKYYDEADSKFTAEYNWQHCVDMHVGETYEVHWPHSKAGACGTVNQYQTPFYDGVFCHADRLDLTQTNLEIGVQAQVFTVVNDEQYYYPDLLRGMIVDGDFGSDMAIYTGSTTGTTRDNEVCSQYSPITWQVDRKCHLISASSFDKMCADMKAQRDDMSDDLYPHGSRELVADEFAADNHQNLRA